ncbi:MAG: radical SAM family heme chaperone HemW [Desulfobacterales bacterium]|nr:radical SAM family heme chaperone HemW [Desulfobacterales bacterium]
MKKREEGIGIYIHIPFCISKCPYCDFNSMAVSPIPEENYIKALIKEIDSHTKPLTVRGKPAKGQLKESLFLEKRKRGVVSIYFGGGTPSLFSVDSIARVINKIMSEFSSTSHVEITLEINPKTADMEKVQALYTIGINRLSLGVQSFKDKLLQNLGRIHTSADAVNLFKDARSSGFSNIGLDLIFGIPDQSLDDWERDLSCALSLKPEHISVYNLTIEEDTPFYDLQGEGKITLPDEDIQVRMYRLAQEKVAAAGYEQYEISNFALPGFRCRHNEGYWTLKEYFGFGAGAHSYLRKTSNKRDWGIRWKNIPNPYEYISLLSNNGTAAIEKEDLTREIAIKEAIFLGLRRLEGISLDDFEKRFGLSLEKTFANIVPYLLKENLISIDEGHLKLTIQGILLSNEVFLKFF